LVIETLPSRSVHDQSENIATVATAEPPPPEPSRLVSTALQPLDPVSTSLMLPVVALRVAVCFCPLA